MTTFLRTRRFRGDVRQGLSSRDVKEEIVKLGNKHFVGGVSKLSRRIMSFMNHANWRIKLGNMMRNSVFRLLHRYILLQSRPTLPNPPRYLGSQQNNRTQPRWHNQRRHSGLQLSTYRDHVVVYQRINSCSRRRRILGSSPAAKLRIGHLFLRLQLNLANGFNGTWKKWAAAVLVLSIEAAVTSYNMRFSLSLSHEDGFIWLSGTVLQHNVL